MKKTLLFLILIIGISVCAQQKQDIVILKNGSIIKGNIISSDSSKTSIESNGNTWSFFSSEIKSIQEKAYISSSIPLRSYIFNLELSINAGETVNPEIHVGILNRFNDKMTAGIGLGATGIDYVGLMPTYFDIRYSLEKSFSLFQINMQTGPMFAFDQSIGDDYNFAFFTEIGPTMNFERPRRKTITVSVGWRFTYLNYDQDSWRSEGPIKTEVFLKRIYFKIGWLLY